MKQHEGYTLSGRARAHYLWMAPSKVRRVLPHIKHKSVQDAIDILQHVSHGSGVQLQKIIKSARANYMQKFPQADPNTLYVKNLYVDEGPRVKRIWRRGRGRADILLKRMCHITALVETRSVSPSSRQSNQSDASSLKNKPTVKRGVSTAKNNASPVTRRTSSTMKSSSSTKKTVESKNKQENDKKNTSVTATAQATKAKKQTVSTQGAKNSNKKESGS